MAKFVFKLQTLLKHRQMLEDRAQQELAKTLRRRMILEGQLRQMQESIRDSRHQLADSLVGRVDLGQTTRFAQFSGQLRLRAQQHVMEMAKLEKEVQARREALVRATQARRAVELLRDKQFAQWQQSEQQRESAVFDELATQQYLRLRAMEAGV
ncbi:MAG: flagellar export protein FliJ [Phycisphaera sp.]|nr:flagellar export protein FliJ [Phycisphaera sp.]